MGKAAKKLDVEKWGTQSLSDRVEREYEALLSATPRIDIDKLKIELEVYQATEGEPPAIRRAKVFSRLCLEKPIFIDDNPIVGTLTQYKYGGYFFPLGSFRWVRKVREFALSRGTASSTVEEREWIAKAADYWDGRSGYDRTREIFRKTHDIDISTDLGKCGVGLGIGDYGSQDTVPDYSMVLNKGLKGILAEIEEQRANLDIGGPEGLSTWYFYEAASLCLNGMITLAQRYASLARDMAGKEADPERRQELERIAETCERVPANPARNFREAMQSVWFAMLGVWLETPQVLYSPPGNFTRYMYPFFKIDRDRGGLGDEEAIEWLHLYFLKINSLTSVLAPHTWSWNQSRLGAQLSLGGLTPDGEDATNELDFLVLEAQQRFRLPEPSVNVIYHDKLSQKFLIKCVDLIRTGIGQPAFHDARKSIERRLLYDNAPLEEARNIAIAGCVQSIIPGYTDLYWESRMNLAKMVEFALNDGVDPLTGKQLGPQTGGAESFTSYDDFYEAFVKQVQHFMAIFRDVSRIGWNVYRGFPVPFGSALVNDCIKKGKDLADGGSRYSFGDGVCLIGAIDAANSLSAIKQLVFREKRLSMGRLNKALDADFEGYEDVQRLCLNAGKYGNDDEEIDSIAKGIYEVCYREHQKSPDYLGRAVQPSAYSVTAHWGLGRFTGALPSGRKGKTSLCDGSVSAQPGTDKNGPTSLIRSAAGAIDTVKYSSNHFNMKFLPSALKGVEGANKFLSMIKTYFDLGGYHVQFNCVTGETLKKAQLDPEQYRRLVVRVAGFSAYFVNLERAVQDEVISRTELSFS